MNTRSFGLRRSFTSLAALLAICCVMLVILVGGASAASAEPLEDKAASNDDLVTAIKAQSAYSLASEDAGVDTVTTATELAAVLSVGGESTAVGDDATGIVTVTGPCDGADGAGLASMYVVAGDQLKGVVFDGPDARITMSSGGDESASGSTLMIIADTDGATFTLSGTGTVRSTSNLMPPLFVGYEGTAYVSVTIESGITVENTGDGYGLGIYHGACDLQEGAMVRNAGSWNAVMVGMSLDEPELDGTESFTIAGTIANTAGPALFITQGTCTLTNTGEIQCNTADGLMGVSVGNNTEDVQTAAAAFTIDGGTIRDTAGVAANARTVGVYSYLTPDTATLTMNDGEVVGGSVDWPTIDNGYYAASGVMTVNGGIVQNQNRNDGGFALRLRGGGALAVQDYAILRGGILVGQNATGTVSISDQAIVRGEPALEVLSPDATVTIGADSGVGPALSALSENTVVVADGCKATVLSGGFTPNAGDATIADSVTAGVQITSSTGEIAELYGAGMLKRINPATFTAVNILRATTGTIELPSVDPGTTVSDATGGEGEIAVVTPYGVVTIGPDAPGVVPGLPEDVVTVYRLYNPYMDGAHLLTADESEVADLEELGWESEGKRFVEYKNPTTGSVAVYRLYNSSNGDHFFTASNAEAASLQSVGWTREGVAWYAPTLTTVPAYRLYNPYQTEFGGLGNHLWTILETERDDLVSLGWQSEGVGWYALPLE